MCIKGGSEDTGQAQPCLVLLCHQSGLAEPARATSIHP